MEKKKSKKNRGLISLIGAAALAPLVYIIPHTYVPAPAWLPKKTGEELMQVCDDYLEGYTVVRKHINQGYIEEYSKEVVTCHVDETGDGRIAKIFFLFNNRQANILAVAAGVLGVCAGSEYYDLKKVFVCSSKGSKLLDDVSKENVRKELADLLKD